MLRKFLPGIVLSLIFTTILLSAAMQAPLIGWFHRKAYDELTKIRYKLKKPPRAINDILLVVIDNETFRSMKERWPYPRSSFAAVIENLKKAGARAIALDFIFYGSSSDKDDGLLRKALGKETPRVILGAIISEEGKINVSTVPAVKESSLSGIVTKVQGPDSVVRRSLTYLLADEVGKRCLLSWEMQLLKVTKGIDISTLADEGASISFSSDKGERWVVPVERDKKSFLINFLGRTADFKKLSFYHVFKGDFDPAYVKHKIVLIGFISSVFWDFYNTPIGPLPGVTLNANAFLTLYLRAFLVEVPKLLALSFIAAGVILASVLLTFFRIKKALMLIAAGIAVFFAVSLWLLASGYVWDYSAFPAAVLLCPTLSKKLMDIIKPIWLNRACSKTEKI